MTEANLSLIYYILLIFTGILTSITAYCNLFYYSPATNKFFVIRFGYVFILYIIIETIILYFFGYSFLIPLFIVILTFVSLFVVPDILLKANIKTPKFITYLLLLWSYIVFFSLLLVIVEEGKIFNKINSDESGLYTGVLSIILVIIPMALHIFYLERNDD